MEGITKACKDLHIPVVSGNVSFYNESPDGPINPTPTIGMIGIVNDVSEILPLGFQKSGDIVMLLRPGIETEANGYCEYLKYVHGVEGCFVPYTDIDSHLRLHEAMRYLAKGHFLNSAHDCAEGGLAVALAECCLNGAELGARIRLFDTTMRDDVQLFSEYQNRIIVSCHPRNVANIVTICRASRISADVIGHVDRDYLEVYIGDRLSIVTSVSQMRTSWKNSLEEQL